MYLYVSSVAFGFSKTKIIVSFGFGCLPTVVSTNADNSSSVGNVLPLICPIGVSAVVCENSISETLVFKAEISAVLLLISVVLVMVCPPILLIAPTTVFSSGNCANAICSSVLFCLFAISSFKEFISETRFSSSVGSIAPSLSKSVLAITSREHACEAVIDKISGVPLSVSCCMFTTFIVNIGAFKPCPAYKVNSFGNLRSYKAYSTF